MVPDLIILALDYYRTPLRFSHLADPERALSESLENLIDDIGSVLSPQIVEAAAKALGIRPTEVERAVHFFLRHVLLSPRNDHYRVLGLSENASDEAIRRHYQLLIGIFHPDRFGDDSEYDTACTARINEAYDVLKHPAERRKYDRQRTSRSRRGAAKGIDGGLVGSHSSTLPLGPTNEPGARVLIRRPWLPTRYLVWWGGGAALVVVTLAILFSNRQPLLRANPDLSHDPLVTLPYLKASPINPIQHPDRSFPANTAIGTREAGPFQSPRPPTVVASSAHLDPSDFQEKEKLKEKTRSQPGKRQPSDLGTFAKWHSEGETGRILPKQTESREASRTRLDLIARLINSYHAGNLDGLVGLFTADAQVNNGSGTDFIRKDYAGLFAETSGRRLSIGNLKWESKNGGRAVGRGGYQAHIKERRNATWQSSSGEVLIELAPWMSGYRIAKLIYTLKAISGAVQPSIRKLWFPGANHGGE